MQYYDRRGWEWWGQDHAEASRVGHEGAVYRLVSRGKGRLINGHASADRLQSGPAASSQV